MILYTKKDKKIIVGSNVFFSEYQELQSNCIEWCLLYASFKISEKKKSVTVVIRNRA